MLAVYPGLIRATTQDELDNAIMTIAVVLGAGVGFALETRFVHFSEQGHWPKRLVRFGLGLLVVLVTRFGLAALFGSLEPEWIFRLIRYAVTGLVLSLAAPWLFVRLRLADQKPVP
jgi:hypothetical protein